MAVNKAEAAGFVLPPMDFEKYAVKEEEPAHEPDYQPGLSGTVSSSWVFTTFQQNTMVAE